MSLLMIPYTNLHELNLDWIINAIRESGVLSVNGQTGVVVLYPEANIEFPDVPSDLSWSLTRKANGTKSGIKFNKAAPMQRVYSNSAFNVYDEGNPPPYPVSSVNGSTGAVVIPIPFDSLSGDLINFSVASPEHSWTLNRKTRDGDAGLTIDTTGDNPKLTLDFINNNETVDESLKILTEKNYVRYFSDCCDAYAEYFNQDNGILPVTAVTAVAMSPAQAEKLTEKLSRTTGKKIELTNRIDPSCLGGVRLDYDGQRLDDTVSHRLSAIRELLKTDVL